MPRVTVAFRHAVKFFPSCSGSFVRTKFRSMGIGMKRFVISTAICVIALQTVLVGIAPLAGLGSSAVDPFLIICRSDGQPHASNNGTGGSDDHRSNSGLRALRPVQHTDGAARTAGRHRHRSACELRTSSSPVSQCAAHCFCSWSHICQRSSAIRHDSVTFQILTKSE